MWLPSLEGWVSWNRFKASARNWAPRDLQGFQERVKIMADEKNQAPPAAPAAQPSAPQASAPQQAPRHEGGHSAGPRREGGPGGGRREGGPGGPGGRPRGKRQFFRKKKVCKFCVEKLDL